MHSFQVGDKIKVRLEVKSPRYNWGACDHSTVFTVTRLVDSNKMYCDSDEQWEWAAHAPEMELVARTIKTGAFAVDVSQSDLEHAQKMKNTSQRLLAYSGLGSLEEFYGFSEGKKISKKKGFMSSLTTIAKKLLDSGTKTLIKAEYLDEELDLTVEGQNALLSILFMEYKDELIKLAKERIKEMEQK